METTLLLYFTSSLFFLYVLSVHLGPLLTFCIEKSFTIKIVSKENILKTWFFFLFILAFLYTNYMIKSGDKLEIMSFSFKASEVKTIGAAIGFIMMLMFYVLPKLIVKNKTFHFDTLMMKMEPVVEEDIFTEKLEIFKSDTERVSVNNSTTTVNNTTINNNIATNVVTSIVYDIKIVGHKDFNNDDNVSRESNYKDYLKLKELETIKDEVLDLENIESLDIEEFNDLKNFRRDGNKTVLLKRGERKKLKDRLYLLSVLDKRYGGHFSRIEIDDLKKIKDVVFFINKHIIFKCEKCPDENEYNDKNFKDWLKKVNK